MWPWEHAAVGYLLYTCLLRQLFDRTPTDREAGLLLCATQFPDLVDKPLAWQFGLLPTGLSLGHSLLVAVPVVLCALGVSLRQDAIGAGIAVAVGYGSHLVGDAVYPWLLGGRLRVGFLFWPLIPVAETTSNPGLLGRIEQYGGQFALLVSSDRGVVVVLMEVLLLGGAVLLWLRDGRPGSRLLRRREPN